MSDTPADGLRSWILGPAFAEACPRPLEFFAWWGLQRHLPRVCPELFSRNQHGLAIEAPFAAERVYFALRALPDGAGVAALEAALSSRRAGVGQTTN